MMLSKSNWVGVMLSIGVFTFAGADQALCQDANTDKSATPEKTQALLQTVQQSELNRRIAIKQTEIDRLKQDTEQSKKDLDTLQKNLQTTALAITESTGNLGKLNTYRKQLQQEMDLNDLQIEAEDLKSDGLQRLSAAQSTALDSLNQRMAEMDVRSQVRQSEVQLLNQGQPVPGEDNDENGSPDLERLRKTLSTDEVKTVEADRKARAALNSASERLAMADDTAARAKRMADDMGKGPDAVGEGAPAEPSPTPHHIRRHASPAPSASPTPAAAKVEIANPKATPTPAAIKPRSNH